MKLNNLKNFMEDIDEFERKQSIIDDNALQGSSHLNFLKSKYDNNHKLKAVNLMRRLLSKW